jgi:hypothetical protein
MLGLLVLLVSLLVSLLFVVAQANDTLKLPMKVL